MPELIKTYEVIGRTAEVAFNIGVAVAKGGAFVIDHMKVGHWSELPPIPQGEVHPPARASITYSGEHDV